MSNYAPKVTEPSTGQIPIINSSIPSTTSASINTFIPELNMSWESGSQLALSDGTPYTRRFSFPTFSAYDNDRLDYIPLPAYDPSYKGSAYFQLITRFKSTEYYSTNTDLHKNFTIWERNTSQLNQNIIYSTEVLSTIRWERQSSSSTIPISGSVGIPPASCSTQFSTTPATSTSTGTGPGFIYATNTDPNSGLPTSYTCRQWNALPLPFSLLFYAGKSIALSVQSDGAFSLLRKSSQSSNTGDPVSGLILMTKPYLQIDFTATSTSPTYVEITTYGKELWRSFSPIFEITKPELLVHPEGTPFSTRLRPPNISVNDNFWNNTGNIDPFQDFTTRQYAGNGVFL